LAYDSSRGEGVVGRGWSLTGLSRIHRCARTVAQDGYTAPATDANADALCLDGERLVWVENDDLELPGSRGFYRTEVDSFVRIVPAAGTTVALSYVLIEKHGGFRIYQKLPGVGVWPLKATVDVNGNYSWADYRFKDDEGNESAEYYPRAIVSTRLTAPPPTPRPRAP
jgi:hypothetical protein